MPTRINIKNQLLVVTSLALLLIVIVTFFPDSTWRIIVGLPILLFIPGYVLQAALFPRKTHMDAVERVAFSFGFSIVVVALIGLILNFMPWGIRIHPILVTLTFFILITSVIAWYRRERFVEEDNPTFSLDRILFHRWRTQNLTNKILYIVLVIAITGATGIVAYVLATPKVEENFTEFYLLGFDGKMQDYPKEVVVGEEVETVVVIVNHEHKTVDYRIAIKIDGKTSNTFGPLVLAPDEAWEKTVSFVPERTGDNQKAEFFIYENTESEPYLKPLHLWLNVKEASDIER